MMRFRLTIFAVLLKGMILLAEEPQSYIENWPEKFSSKLLIRDWINQESCVNATLVSDYLNPTFVPLIDKSEVSLILEVGSRDAVDALSMSEYYKAIVYAFECYPEAIDICKYNIGKNPNIILEPLAVWNENTSLTFFPVIPGGQDFLIGASSVFKIDPEGPFQDTQNQGKITVQAIRLDTWMKEKELENIDLMCIDVQGATLQVVQGLGERLSNVKYIIAEVEHQRYYVGQKLYPAVEEYMCSQGFTPMAEVKHPDHIGVSDVLFIRNDLIH